MVERFIIVILVIVIIFLVYDKFYEKIKEFFGKEIKTNEMLDLDELEKNNENQYITEGVDNAISAALKNI